MKKTSTWIALVLASLIATACASMVSGTKENISLSSSPPGARVRIAPPGIDFATPVTLPLNRKDAPYHLTFTLEGYGTYEADIDTVTNGWVWGNILLGGLIGVAVDFSTGAAKALTPKQIHATLEKLDASMHEPSGSAVLVFAEDGSLLATVVLE